MTSQGQLERFDLVPVSAPCVSWSGTTLTVQQSYGWVLPPAGEFLWNGTAFHYSKVVPGELGLVLTTVESAPASFDPSIPITPNPPRSLASAWVIPAGRSESIRMGVTQALASLIPLGVRGLTDREPVSFDTIDGRLTVVDVRDAPWTRDLADASAQALTLATPHHTVSVDPAPASVEGFAEGHTWVQITSATDETVTAIWRVVGGAWVSQSVDEPLVAPVADVGVLRVALLIAEAIKAGELKIEVDGNVRWIADSDGMRLYAADGVTQTGNLDGVDNWLHGERFSSGSGDDEIVLMSWPHWDIPERSVAGFLLGDPETPNSQLVLGSLSGDGASGAFLSTEGKNYPDAQYGAVLTLSRYISSTFQVDAEASLGVLGDAIGVSTRGGNMVSRIFVRENGVVRYPFSGDTGWQPITSLNPGIIPVAGHQSIAFRIKDGVLAGRGMWDVAGIYGSSAWTRIGFVPTTITSKLPDEETSIPVRYLDASAVLRIVKSTRALEFRPSVTSGGRVAIPRTLID